MVWFPDTIEEERAPEIAPLPAPAFPFPEWSEAEVAQLLALRAEGLTCVQVAERMGKTKGMIVGKLAGWLSADRVGTAALISEERHELHVRQR